MKSAEKDWITGENQVQPERTPLTKLTSIKIGMKKMNFAFLLKKKTDGMHDKYSLCLKDQNLFFKNDFFPLSFRMHLPHLPTPVLNLNCMVSSERMQDHGLSWGGTEVLWSQ